MRLTRWLVCKYLSQPTHVSASDGGIKTPPQIPWDGCNGFPPDPIEWGDLPSTSMHILIHRAVWCSFRGRVEDGYVVDYRNNQSDDDQLTNLRAVPFSENIHSFRKLLGHRARSYWNTVVNQIETQSESDLERNERPSWHKKLGYFQGHVFALFI